MYTGWPCLAKENHIQHSQRWWRDEGMKHMRARGSSPGLLSACCALSQLPGAPGGNRAALRTTQLETKQQRAGTHPSLARASLCVPVWGAWLYVKPTLEGVWAHLFSVHGCVQARAGYAVCTRRCHHVARRTRVCMCVSQGRDVAAPRGIG